MTTFSQLVDRLLLETRRPDMRADIITYANQTIRELHTDPESNKVLFFADNFRQLLLTADVDNGFSWEIPNPATFQKLHVVQFMGVYDGCESVFSTPTTPGRHLNSLRWYHYQAGNRFFFNGYGGLNMQIALGYYEFPQRLVYQAEADRLVTWDEEAQVFVYDPSLNTDELREAALAKVSNWMLIRWVDTVAEGLRAKIYKRVSDTERARTCYSMYQQMRAGMWTSENAQTAEFL